MTDQAKAELLAVGDLLCRCLDHRPDVLKSLLREQAPIVARLCDALDPLSFEHKVAALFVRACNAADPGPSATIWDAPAPAKQVPILDEVLAVDPQKLAGLHFGIDFADFQRRLRAALDEDSLPSARRKLIEMRPQLENAKRIAAGSVESEIFRKALALVQGVARGT